MTTINAIVSAYYAEEYLDNRIRNLLEQTREVTPVIVCQAGSKEQHIAEKYKECKIYTTYDIPTVYEAWNMATQFESDYIAIANADDLYLKNYAVDKMATVLDNNSDIGLVYADAVVVNEPHGDPVSYFDLREPEADLYDGCYLGSFQVYRSDLHRRYGLFDTRYQVAGDYEFWLRLQRGGIKFYHVKEYLGEFLDHGDNIEFRKQDRMIWEAAVIKRHYGRAE